ncbi:HlyD family secretion protein [Acinetobacter sp.]|uniref:HlyD family secretion protein n=1 Tax=Acinetobacter sp. TaxID=472 RepID=UPI00389079E3
MKQENNFFRKEVIDSKKSKYIGKVIVSPPITFKVLVYIFGVMGIIFLIFLFFGSFTKKIIVQGQLVPLDGYSKVYSLRNSIIDELYVQEGDIVVKGQKLIKSKFNHYVDNNNIYDVLDKEISLRQELYTSEILREKNIVEETKKIKISEISYLKQQILSKNERLLNAQRSEEIIMDNFKRYQTAYSINAVSLEDYKQKEKELIDNKNTINLIKNEVSTIEESLENKEKELKLYETESLNKISQMQRQKSEFNQELIQGKSQSQQIITSPIDGKITSINIEKGQSIDVNKLIMNIVPKNSKLICVLYLPSSSIGFLKVGNEISIKFNAYPYQKFGFGKAKIMNISETPIPYQELNSLGFVNVQNVVSNEPIYIIKAELNDQYIKVYGEKKELKVGMLLEADISLETRKIYEWILEPLYTISGKL